MSDTALVSNDSSPDHNDLARIKTIFKRHDPRRLKQGQTGYLRLSEQDINTVLITSLAPLNNARANTRLSDNQAVIDVSLKLPDNQYGQYANISLQLKKSPNHLLIIEKVNFGTLTIPGWLVKPVWKMAQKYLQQFEEYRLFSNAIQMLQISGRYLTIVYKADWEAVKQLKQRGQDLLVSDSERVRIQRYQNQLLKIINEQTIKHQRHRSISFSDILPPLFQFALSQSSETEQHSAIAENKALLFVLAMYAAGKNIELITGQAQTAQPVYPRNRPQMTLRKRVDLMQHFSISAFLASAAGDALAQATGVYKEISDSKGGSGFSFADLAADRAGVEFGTLAIASESSARQLQAQMARSTNENDYMPNIDHLPEGLQEASFKRQYGSPEDARYQKMQSELDRRIRLCRLYQ